MNLSAPEGDFKRHLTPCFLCQDEQIALDKPSSAGGALREPSSLAHSAYSLAASAFSSQDATLYINGAGISYTYRGYPGLGAAMQHPVSLTGGTSAQSNGKSRIQVAEGQSASFRSRMEKPLASGCYRHFATSQMTQNPFLVMADHLTAHHNAVIRRFSQKLLRLGSSGAGTRLSCPCCFPVFTTVFCGAFMTSGT